MVHLIQSLLRGYAPLSLKSFVMINFWNFFYMSSIGMYIFQKKLGRGPNLVSDILTQI